MRRVDRGWSVRPGYLPGSVAQRPSAYELDLAVLRLVRTHCHRPGTEYAVERLSRLGEHGAVWIALSLAGAAVSERSRPQFVRAARTVAAAYAANQILKLAVRRRRPSLAGLPPLIRTTSNLSYPSAHATTSFAGARALSMLLPAPALYAGAVAISLSRPYLGVHWPTDVLAGAALGSSIARLIA